MKNKSLNLKTKQLFKKAISFITAVAMVITILPLQPITAYAEGTPEVLWGTSADSLTNSGTWEQLYNILNTEKENTSINYVKANKSDVVVLYDLPVYKKLTVDIAGHNLHLTSLGFISAKVPDVTVTVLDTAENDGTLNGNCTRIIFIEGTLNLEGGKFENNLADGAVITSGGASTCVDISRHPDPEGITIKYLMAELSEEAFKNQFKLPEDYAWFDSENNTVTAMKPDGIYTVGKSSEGITYNVTVNYTIGGGDVTAQPSAATEGTAVNITVSPYYNRELVSLKVKQGDTEIPVTDNQFIMPAGDVVIYPEFRIINPTIEVTAADGTVTLTDVFWQAMAAVENSTSLETTVKLLDNITIPEHDHDVSKGVFTFNLNGKTINGGGDEAALDFGADTKVVITGNGTVENAVNAIKTASDSLTIENGNFTGTKNAINICGGNTTIKSGTFTVDYNSGSETAVNLTGGKAVINGGSFTSVSVALHIEYSEAEVNGGTFTAPNAISIYIDGKLSISGNASIDGEYFDINNSSFGTPVIITSEIDANAPISLITGYAGSPLAKGADGITLNPDWFASADPAKIISYNQIDNTIYLKKCTHSWSEDNTCAICGITGYGVYIKGIHINELNAKNVLGDGTVSYNAQTATLTLSGADISNSDNSHSLEIDNGDITLVLIGENSLGAGDENHFAVWIENGASLTVSENSTGSLTAPTGLKATENYGYLSQEKIYVNRSITGGGDFTVKGGTVSGSIFMGGDIAITGGTVNADYLAAENVTITGGSIIADGKANIEYYDRNAPYGTYGIYADNNILISGGTVTTSGGYASVNESALKLNSISKATATAAMYAGNAIDITGGTVTATGGQWNNYVPDPLGFMKLGSYNETPSDFAKPDTVIDLYGKALKAQSFTISDNAVFICGSDTTHDMQYCAGDAENTIAYKCVFCGKTAENITATVNAEDAVYNGSAYDKASVVYSDSWNSSKNLIITYTGTTFGGEYYNSTTAPSAAGEYTAFVTLNDVTVSDKFEIVKGTPEYTAPTGLSATYGDTLAKVKLPEGWAWKDKTTTSVGNIGENKFTAIYTPADTANYNPVEVELTVKVNAKPAEKPVHTHSWSSLKNDSTSHYYECACGAKDEVTAHTYNTSGRCTVCGYYNANAVAKPVVTPTPAPTATPQPTEKPAEMPKEADTTITQAKPTEEAVEAAKDNVTVSEGTAQLDKEAVEAVADAQSEEKEIVLPLTQTTENVVNKAEIDTEALTEIAKGGKDVVIQFTDATVKLEAEAVKALTEQAKGSTIEIRAVIVEAHTLNEYQQEELKDTDHVVIISVQVFSDGEYIGQFRGGKATVMLPFQLDPGTKAEEYRVYYIDEKGDLHKVASEYIDGHMVFTTVHFSEYIIAHEAAQNGDTDVVTPQQPEQETSFPILPIIIAVAAIVIILIIFKKKKEDDAKE